MKKLSGAGAVLRLESFFRQYPNIADGLRRAKRGQRWEDFFAELGIKAQEPQPIKKAKRAA